MENRKVLMTAPAGAPSDDILQKAAAVLESGDLIAYPTRCIYGLGADALSVDAVRKVYRIKQRPFDKPLSILIPRREDLQRWAAGITPGAIRLMDRFWPGKVTFVFAARDTLPDVLLGKTGRIGIRLPAHSVARALVEAFGRPLTATSANLSGGPACVSAKDLPVEIVRRLGLVLDAGSLEGGVGSTVVDLSGDQPVVLREGVVPADTIINAW